MFFDWPKFRLSVGASKLSRWLLLWADDEFEIRHAH